MRQETIQERAIHDRAEGDAMVRKYALIGKEIFNDPKWEHFEQMFTEYADREEKYALNLLCVEGGGKEYIDEAKVAARLAVKLRKVGRTPREWIENARKRKEELGAQEGSDYEDSEGTVRPDSQGLEGSTGRRLP